MERQLVNKIQDLQIRLNTCDLYARSVVCDEFMELIRTTENEELKVELCKIVMPYLVDLDRDLDLSFCDDLLMAHHDYHSHLTALWVRALVCRRHENLDGQIAAFRDGIKIALLENDEITLSEGYLHRGKVLLQKKQFDESLEDFNRLIPIAEKLNNYNLVAISLYYIALALRAKGHIELCLQKLRESSEMACRQHSQSIVMQTEIVRAKIQMDLGRTDVAKRILDDWYEEFSLML
ncbi:MAG: tetratricopeptide repeat protein [Parabacteroides sp.]|nr:tetratricopeptide repeat protein [Parabacteroides sp.]